jgi:hypothetical protein
MVVLVDRQIVVGYRPLMPRVHLELVRPPWAASTARATHHRLQLCITMRTTVKRAGVLCLPYFNSTSQGVTTDNNRDIASCSWRQVFVSDAKLYLSTSRPLRRRLGYAYLLHAVRVDRWKKALKHDTGYGNDRLTSTVFFHSQCLDRSRHLAIFGPSRFSLNLWPVLSVLH